MFCSSFILTATLFTLFDLTLSSTVIFSSSARIFKALGTPSDFKTLVIGGFPSTAFHLRALHQSNDYSTEIVDATLSGKSFTRCDFRMLTMMGVSWRPAIRLSLQSIHTWILFTMDYSRRFSCLWASPMWRTTKLLEQRLLKLTLVAPSPSSHPNSRCWSPSSKIRLQLLGLRIRRLVILE